MKITMKEIKNHLIVTIKESIKFALLSMAVILLIGIPSAYISIYILKIDGEIPVIITGVIIAIVTFVIDNKKFYCLKRVHDNRFEILEKI